jgi:hypothetical protein
MIADNKKDLLWILLVSVLILLWSSIPTWAGCNKRDFLFLVDLGEGRYAQSGNLVRGLQAQET